MHRWLQIVIVLALMALVPASAWAQARTEDDTTDRQTLSIDDPDEVADAFRLSPAYPNPFNPSTQFTLTVAETQDVTIDVYDLLGHHVARLHDGLLPGQQTYRFTFEPPSSAPSGLYLIRAVGEDFTATQRVTLLK